jgi:hypothetical protein
MMSEADVLWVLDVLEDAGITVFLDGGWAVDALLQRQTREHVDLDVVALYELRATPLAVEGRNGGISEYRGVARPRSSAGCIGAPVVTRNCAATPDHPRPHPRATCSQGELRVESL